jgi:hypothetical protein
MIKSSGQGGHSAQVKMRLLLNDSSIPIAQMGPDFLILETAMEHPPSDATLELCVDASERPLESAIAARHFQRLADCHYFRGSFSSPCSKSV